MAETPALEQQVPMAADASEAELSSLAAPPTRPPPRKDSLGPRGVLNSLRALNPVVQLVKWSAGGVPPSNGGTTPETPRGIAASDKPYGHLPSMRQPPTPPPTRGTGRRPNPTGMRTSAAAASAREASPQLPTVRSESVPSLQPSPPGSSRPKGSRTRSFTPSKAETPRLPEAPQQQQSASPVPRKRPSKQPAVQDVTRTGKCREMMEVQGHAQLLLGLIYEFPVTDEAACSILDEYPELAWLANCLRRCPLPANWTSVEAGGGNVRYLNSETENATETPPLLNDFADLARLMLQWRQCPDAAPEVESALQAAGARHIEEAVRARRVWNGPHIDPQSGQEFWHCHATGCSTWGDPGMAAEFMGRVADRLKRALGGFTAVTADSKATAPAAPEAVAISLESAVASRAAAATPLEEATTANAATARVDGASPAETVALATATAATEAGSWRPGTGSREEVREMMAKIASNLKPSKGDENARKKATPRRPRARGLPWERPCAQEGAEAREEDVCEMGLEEDIGTPGRRRRQNVRRPSRIGGGADAVDVPQSDMTPEVNSGVADAMEREGSDGDMAIEGDIGTPIRRRRPVGRPTCTSSGSRAATVQQSDAKLEVCSSMGEGSRVQREAAAEFIAVRRPSAFSRRRRFATFESDGRLDALPSGSAVPLGSSVKLVRFSERQPEIVEPPLAPVPSPEPLASQAEVSSPSSVQEHVQLQADDEAPTTPVSRSTELSARRGTPYTLSATAHALDSVAVPASVMPGNPSEDSTTGSPGAGMQLRAAALANVTTVKLEASAVFGASTVFGATGASQLGASTVLGCTGASELGVTGASQLGDTAFAGKLCAGAIEAALEDAFGGPVVDVEICDEGASTASAACVSPRAGGDATTPPPSPSLISICPPHSPPGSPSILLLDGPVWTSHKELPKGPQTPPRSSRKERPVVLGVPEPLSARARCGLDEPPLSARKPRSRPAGKRRIAEGGA